MNLHDGIPFIKFGGKDNYWIINPIHIIRLADMSEEECKVRKVRKPSTMVYLINHPADGLCVIGNTAEEIMEKVNKTMISYKDKLAEKTLLE